MTAVKPLLMIVHFTTFDWWWFQMVDFQVVVRVLNRSNCFNGSGGGRVDIRLHNLRSRNVTPCDKQFVTSMSKQTNGLLCNVLFFIFAFLRVVLDTCMGNCNIKWTCGFVVVLQFVSPSFVVVASINGKIPRVTPLSQDDMLITSWRDFCWTLQATSRQCPEGVWSDVDSVESMSSSSGSELLH